MSLLEGYGVAPQIPGNTKDQGEQDTKKFLESW